MANLYAGNNRPARIARWLRDPVKSERVTELVLECGAPDEPAIVLSRWERADVTPELCHTIDELIQDYSNDKSATVSAALSWRLADGTAWLSKAFRALPQPEASDAGQTAQRLDGSSLSIITQLQRSVEAKDRMMVDMFRQSEERWGRMLDVMDRQLERLQRRAELAEDVAEAAGDEIAQAESVAERATAVAEQALQQVEEADQDDKLGKVVELVQRSLMSGTGG